MASAGMYRVYLMATDDRDLPLINADGRCKWHGLFAGVNSFADYVKPMPSDQSCISHLQPKVLILVCKKRR